MGDSIRVVKPPRATRKTKATPWQEHLTIDVVYAAWNKTLGHPFVAWLVPVCFRTVMIPYENISMRLAIAYASLLTLLWIGSVFNKRIAFGIPREVDLDEEVIVITGGASGLGRLIADFYAMKGANVAVLDVKKDEDDEMMGIDYYHCDVSDFKQVEASIANIRNNVCSWNSLFRTKSAIMLVDHAHRLCAIAGNPNNPHKQRRSNAQQIHP